MTSEFKKIQLNSGFRRGYCEYQLCNLDSLQSGQIVASQNFFLGEFEWKLALCLGFDDVCQSEYMKVSLLSCNALPVCGNINLSIGKQITGANSVPKRKKKAVCEFGCFCSKSVLLDQLNRLNEESNFTITLMVAADLKNLRVATAAELQMVGNGTRGINVEVIDNERIDRTFFEKTIGSPSNQQGYKVNSKSNVNLWAQKESNCRYWLCERCSSNEMMLTRCLNEQFSLDCFEDICKENKHGRRSVTVFKEEKKNCVPFKPVDDNTVVIFCSLEEPNFKDPTYLGHLLIQRTTGCLTLIQRVINELAQLPEGLRYDVYVNKEKLSPEKIQSSLAQCGLHSGSWLTLKTWPNDRQREFKSGQAPLQCANSFEERMDDRQHEVNELSSNSLSLSEEIPAKTKFGVFAEASGLTPIQNWNTVSNPIFSNNVLEQSGISVAAQRNVHSSFEMRRHLSGSHRPKITASIQEESEIDKHLEMPSTCRLKSHCLISGACCRSLCQTLSIGKRGSVTYEARCEIKERSRSDDASIEASSLGDDGQASNGEQRHNSRSIAFRTKFLPGGECRAMACQTQVSAKSKDGSSDGGFSDGHRFMMDADQGYTKSHERHTSSHGTATSGTSMEGMELEFQCDPPSVRFGWTQHGGRFVNDKTHNAADRGTLSVSAVRCNRARAASKDLTEVMSPRCKKLCFRTGKE